MYQQTRGFGLDIWLRPMPAASAARSVAIVLSGAYRTLTDCNASVVQHVIAANPTVSFHVFAHLTTESFSKAEHQQAEQAVWATFPCVAAVKFETNAAVSADVRRDLPGTDELPRGRGTARGKAMNIVKMFRGIGTAQQLLESSSGGGGGVAPSGARTCAAPAVVGGGARRPREYDLVLRLRPDLCFCGPLDLSPMLTRHAGQQQHLWLPWWSSSPGWAFDQIAVGSPAAMQSYAAKPRGAFL